MRGRTVVGARRTSERSLISRRTASKRSGRENRCKIDLSRTNIHWVRCGCEPENLETGEVEVVKQGENAELVKP